MSRGSSKGGSSRGKGNSRRHSRMSKSQRDQRANSLNPNNRANKSGNDNRSNQMNPNNSTHASSRRSSGSSGDGVRGWMRRVRHEYKPTLTKRIRIKISRLEHNLQPKRMKMKTVNEAEQPFAFPFSVQWVRCGH